MVYKSRYGLDTYGLDTYDLDLYGLDTCGYGRAHVIKKQQQIEGGLLMFVALHCNTRGLVDPHPD